MGLNFEFEKLPNEELSSLGVRSSAASSEGRARVSAPILNAHVTFGPAVPLMGIYAMVILARMHSIFVALFEQKTRK